MIWKLNSRTCQKLKLRRMPPLQQYPSCRQKLHKPSSTISKHCWRHAKKLLMSAIDYVLRWPKKPKKLSKEQKNVIRRLCEP